MLTMPKRQHTQHYQPPKNSMSSRLLPQRPSMVMSQFPDKLYNFSGWYTVHIVEHVLGGSCCRLTGSLQAQVTIRFRTDQRFCTEACILASKTQFAPVFPFKSRKLAVASWSLSCFSKEGGS